MWDEGGGSGMEQKRGEGQEGRDEGELLFICSSTCGFMYIGRILEDAI